MQGTLQHFREQIDGIDLSGETGIDAEIRSHIPQIDLLCADPSVDVSASADDWVALVVPVRSVVESLQEKLKLAKTDVQDLERRRQELIETA
jgi:hypothetical protein